MTKDERQQITFDKWITNNKNGIIQGSTGYGKTYMAINKMIAHVKSMDINSTILVVVPSISLQKDWIRRSNEYSNVQVVVINTVIKNNYKVDLLVLDEIHNFAAKTFSKVFNVINYKMLLGLSPKLDRSDDRHSIILQHTKIIDDIPLKECISNGWIANYTVEKIPITLSDKDRYALKKFDLEFKRLSEELSPNGNSFKAANSAIKCIQAYRWYVSIRTGKFFSKEAIEGQLKKLNRSSELDVILSSKFRTINRDEAKPLVDRALIAKDYFKVVMGRKSLLHINDSKFDKTIELLNEYKHKKIILFSKSIIFLERISKNLDLPHSIYHSKMGIKAKRKSLDEYVSNKTNIMLSVDSLNEGLDIPSIEVAIFSAYNSSKTQSIQKNGRILRLFGDKVAKLIYLYTPNSQEEKWLNNLQLGS